jgi:hypothetical protein
VKFSVHPLKMLSAVGALAALVHAGDYSTWARYRPVTLSTSGMGLSAAVTNIPLSIRFKASAHKDMLDSAATQVQANGSDIRVTKADGTTDVPFEIEYLATGAGGALHLWVLADNVPANDPSAATYRVYWGRTGQTSMSAPASVFPSSAGFQAVFHMNDTGAVITNAANSSLNGTAVGTTTTTGQQGNLGWISARSGNRVRTFGTSNGGVDDANAAADYIHFTPAPSATLSTHGGPITMEGWVYSSITNSGNTSPGTKHIIAHGNGGPGGKAWLARTAAADGASAQNHYSAGGPSSIRGPIAPFQEQNHWQYVAAVWNGTTYTIYRQRESDPWNNATISGPTGMVPDSVHYKTYPGTAPVASTNPWFIGGASTDSTSTTSVTRGWQGWMEEVRISTVARDSNYVKLNFLTFRSDTIAGSIHPISIGGTESPAAVGNYGAWTNRRSIVLNTTASGANVAGTVTNFPVLIRLGSAEAATIAAANGGNSLRFSKADNTTALPYQIESWSPTAAAIWVKVDSIKGNNNTQVIRMHWGNGAAASESNGAAVFDTTLGYEAVWHFSEGNSDTAFDATANNLKAAPERSNATDYSLGPEDTVGVIGRARRYGTNSSGAPSATAANAGNSFQVPNSASGPLNFGENGTYTVSAWVNVNAVGTSRSMLSKGDRQYFLELRSGGRQWEFSEYQATIGWNQTLADTVKASTPQETATNNQWQHLVGVRNGTSQKLYWNGVMVDSTINIDGGTTSARTTNNFTIGRNPTSTGSRYFRGELDEIRVASVARSFDWIKLEYQNQRDVNTLANIGLPVYTVPGQPTAVTAVADTAKANISWTAPANNGGKPILGYKAMVVGDTALSCETTGATSCSILNLAAGTTYNVVVRASNEVGGGPNSLASNAVVPIAPIVPTAPRTPSAVVNSSSAVTVSWTAPAYNGGSIITGYTVTSNPGSLTCVTAGELSCQVTGLTQATPYTFSIVATNIAGNSPAATVNATTTGILPGSFVIHMDAARNPYTYRLPASAVASTDKLTMSISDVQGKTVWTRTITPAATKVAELTWDGTTSKGLTVSAGMYVVRLQAERNGKIIEAIQAGVKQ